MAKNYLLKRALVGLTFKYLREKDRIAKNKKQVKKMKHQNDAENMNKMMESLGAGANSKFAKVVKTFALTMVAILILLIMLLSLL